MVRSEHVRTLFDSTQSQESKSEVSVRNRTRQSALGPILRHTLYLWCLGSNVLSDLTMPELVIADSKLVLNQTDMELSDAEQSSFLSTQVMEFFSITNSN